MIRVGLMISGDKIEGWKVKVLKKIKKTEGISIALIVKDSREPENWYKRVYRILSKTGTLYKIWRKLSLFLGNYENQELQHVPQWVYDGTDEIGVTPRREGYSEYIPINVVDDIKSYNLDVIIRFGFGIIRGEILRIPTYGVWSYHHGDPKEYRGRPPTFWEIYEGSRITGAVLQRLNEDLDGGVILKKGYISTRLDSHFRSIEAVLELGVGWVSAKLKSIRSNRYMPVHENLKYSEKSDKIFRLPGAKKVFYVYIITCLMFTKHVAEYLFKVERWVVAKSNKNLVLQALSTGEIVLDSQSLDIVEVTRDIRDAFRADPFYICSSKERIICERFNLVEGSGELVILEESASGTTETSLEYEKEKNDPAHVSYPYTFRENRELFVIPEITTEKSVRLYSLDAQAGVMSLESTLLEGNEFIDPSLVFHAGKYWLFVTVNKQDGVSYLLLFFSESIRGPYAPNEANPVKSDVRTARNAGSIFKANGNLYRPAQDCSVTYGERVYLNRIEVLSESSYFEEVVAKIEVGQSDMYSGVHTVNVSDKSTVVDARYDDWSILGPYYKWKYILR